MTTTSGRAFSPSPVHMSKRLKLNANLDAASASEWREKHAEFFGIVVHRQTCQDFFGLAESDLPCPDYKRIAPVLSTPTADVAFDHGDDETGRFFDFVEAVTRPNALESATDNFVQQLFLLLKYEHERLRVVINFDQSLIMSGVRVDAYADLAVLDKASVALMVVESTPVSNPDFPDDGLPTPQLAAEMISLFQRLQRLQLERTGVLLREKLIPGIIFRGTMPYLFTMNVTNALSESVSKRIRYSSISPPSSVNILNQCILDVDYYLGVSNMAQRRVIFSALERFKLFIFP